MRTADVIVVGGGIAGLGAGAMLAEDAKVIVLEREDQPGYHTTGRSAAMYIENYGAEAVRQLTRASRKPLETRNAYWPDAVLSPRGVFYLARNAEEEAELDELVESSGGAVSYITVDEAAGKVPILRREAAVRCAFEAEAEDMDVNAILMGFRRKLKDHGGELVCKRDVTSMVRVGGIWTVKAGGEEYSAPVIVNAAGAWVDQIAALAGLEPLGFEPCRRSAAIVPTPGIDVSTWPTTAVMDESFYFRPEAGKLMISPADETLVEPHDAFADDMSLAEGIDAFSGAFDFEVTRIEHTWGGLRTFSPDRIHVIGFDPRTEGFFWFAGQGGYGIQSAHGGAMLVASLVHHGTVSDELARFGVSQSTFAPERLLT